MDEIQEDSALRRPWEPMRLTYVSSVGELMQAGFVGSRLDNNTTHNCTLTNRRTGGTGDPC